MQKQTAKEGWEGGKIMEVAGRKESFKQPPGKQKETEMKQVHRGVGEDSGVELSCGMKAGGQAEVRGVHSGSGRGDLRKMDHTLQFFCSILNSSLPLGLSDVFL